MRSSQPTASLGSAVVLSGSVADMETRYAAAPTPLGELRFAGRNMAADRLPLAEGTYTLGRGANCDLVVPSVDISREQLRLEVGEGGLWVTDRGSRNGTLRAGKPLRHRTYIRWGESLTVGGTMLSMQRLGAPEAGQQQSATLVSPRLPAVLLAGTALLLVAAAAVWLWQRDGTSAAAVAVDETYLSSGSITETTADTETPADAWEGVLSARRAATLTFEVGGTVRAVHVREGEHVAAGKVLVEIYNRELSRELGVANQELQRIRRLAEMGLVPRRDVSDARTAYDDAAQRYGVTRLKAPFDGVVARLQAVEGGLVESGADALTIVDLSAYYVDLGLSGDTVAGLQLGAVVDVQLAGQAEPLAGRIENVAMVANPETELFRVRVALAYNGEVPLLVGARAAVRVRAAGD